MIFCLETLLLFGNLILCHVSGFSPRFEQYALDSSRNETGRYRARTNAELWYLCHYQGESFRTSDLEKNKSSKCVEQNENARDEEEDRENKYPYFYPSIGEPPGCLVPPKLANGGWFCQEEGKDNSYRTVVPVYHSCWPFCYENYTLSELRDFRCTEKRIWDGKLSKIFCKENVANNTGTVNDVTPTLEEKNRDLAMHEVFIIAGSVVLFAAVVLVVVCFVKNRRTAREERSLDSSTVMPLMVSVSCEEQPVGIAHVGQDSSYGSMEGENAENREEGSTRGALSSSQLRVDLETSKKKGSEECAETLSNPDSNGSDDSGVMDNGICDDGKEPPEMKTENSKIVTSASRNEAKNKLLAKTDVQQTIESGAKVLVNTVSHTEVCTDDMGDKAVPDVGVVTGSKVTGSRCAMTIEAMLNSQNYYSLQRDLGHLLDPPHKDGDQKTWKGIASAILHRKDHEIRAIEYHSKGDHNNGHFVRLLDEMKAEGVRLGDLVEYFSRQESLRTDVIENIAKVHSDCSFCRQYFTNYAS